MPLTENLHPCRDYDRDLQYLREYINDIKEQITGALKALEKHYDTTFTDYKNHLAAILTERDKHFELMTSAAEKAVGKAEVSTDKRFEAINEFRSQLREQVSAFLPRSEFSTQIKSLEDKLELARIDRMNLLTRSEYISEHKALEDRVVLYQTKLDEYHNETLHFIPRAEHAARDRAVDDKIEQIRKEITTTSFSPREDIHLNAKLDALVQEVVELRESKSKFQGGIGMAQWGIAILMTVIGVLLGHMWNSSPF